MTRALSILLLLVLAPAFLLRSHHGPPYTAATLPTGDLLSEPGPTFRWSDSPLPSPLTVSAHGDQRFTDPTNVKATNPRVRQWLVQRIAEEKPAGVVVNGDIPLSGEGKNDYAVSRAKTEL
jgi:hypothetical protein